MTNEAVIYRNLTQPEPRNAPALDRLLAPPMISARKKSSVLLWSPAYVPEGATRSNASVQHVSAWVADLDEGDPNDTLRKLAESGLEHWAHTSWSHSDAQAKWRVIVPYSDPLPPEKHRRLWNALAQEYAPQLDGQCKATSHAYYLPSHHPDREDSAILYHLPGERLDWRKYDSEEFDPQEESMPLAEGTRKLSDAQLCTLIERIGRDFPGKGSRHELALALGGALRRELICDEHIGQVVECSFILGGASEPTKHVTSALHSARSVAQGQAAYGWATVKSILGSKTTRKLREVSGALEAGINPETLRPKVCPTEPDQDSESTPWPNAESRSLLPLDRDAKGFPKNTVANVERILSGHPAWSGVLAFDELSNRTVSLRNPPSREGSNSEAAPWSDVDTERTRVWINDMFGFEPSKNATDAAVEMTARRSAFHPVRRYLSGLPQWDGEHRLVGMLSDMFGAVDNKYHEAIGKRFMISAVARAMDPGCKVDTMLILEGEQGQMKSSAIHALVSDGSWFSDSALDLRSKDAVQNLQGKWIYEVQELDAFRRAEITAIKAFVSSRVDNIRPSYGRRNVDMPRQCVFVGSTNQSNYLTDTTGNRRFWPVACGTIDLDAIRQHRDQLWAEALHLFVSGEQHWLTKEESTFARVQQEEREEIDPWESKLQDWIESEHIEDFAAHEAFEVLGVDTDRQTLSQTQRIGGLLKRMGWVSYRKRKGRNLVRHFRSKSEQSDQVHRMPSPMGVPKASGNRAKANARNAPRDAGPQDPRRVEAGRKRDP